MGQCMSRKAAGAFAASAAAAHSKPTKMQKHGQIQVRKTFSLIYENKKDRSGPRLQLDLKLIPPLRGHASRADLLSPAQRIPPDQIRTVCNCNSLST
jgi:hypothetical protein